MIIERRTPSLYFVLIIAVSLICMILSIGLLKPPEIQDTPREITTKDILLDVSLFQTATLAYSFLVTNNKYRSGVGLEIMNNGSLSRGVGEFLSFWKYETDYQVANYDPNKNKKTFILHPLIGYEYTNYLMAKGYSKKMAFLTSFIAIYIFEKGVQGSFETPSMYDFFSYTSGISASILINDFSRRCYENDNYLLKGVGLILNPFYITL
jgi:hypothetical protein